MKIYCNGAARIRHAKTGKIFDIQSDELDWEAVDGEERSMGPVAHYEASVNHPELGQLTWGLWEYPIGVENDRDTDVGVHKVIADFDYGLEHEEPEPQD